MEDDHIASSQMPSNPHGNFVVNNTALMPSFPHKEIAFLSPPSQVENSHSDFMDENMGSMSTSSPLPHASNFNGPAWFSMGQAPSLNAGLGRWNGCMDWKKMNWHGIYSYLAGQVRPRPDGSPIYRCYLCPLEFPTAQAFGGHVSSHTRRRKKEASVAQTATQATNLKGKIKKPTVDLTKKWNEKKEKKD